MSGIPRSGSTVLSSLLNQHPQIHSTATSGLVNLMGSLCRAWESSPEITSQSTDKEEAYRMLRSLLQSKYEPINKPIIIDKNRGWVAPAIMTTMEQVLGSPPRIIATVRSPTDCAASFVRIAKPKDVNLFLKTSELIHHLKHSYVALEEGYKFAPKNFCIVDYDELLRFPQKQMDRIAKFLNLDKFSYNFNNIDTEIVAEQDDKAWGIPDLHKISSRLEKQHNQDSKQILGNQYDEFDQPKFWLGESVSTRKPKKIDLSVQESMKGNFKKSYKILQEAEKETPECNKIAFNMGWYALRQGKLQEGMEGLSRGRYENCFGNPKPPVHTSIWDGKSMGTVLYYLEGGLGDQIHALKYIQDINKRGCDIVVACSGELFPIAKSCIGVKTICEHDAAGGIYHDHWIPSMSVLLTLKYEYDDIKGLPYIPRTHTPKNKRPVIGVRWQGNPKFEHEQNRKFPLKPFFDAMKEINADFICLQRDEGTSECPDFIKKVPLNNWEETRDAISKCDLVISSCTSIAHLAGAMGVKTWIIVPVLNYYIWSVPGNKTPYYDSVQLFRQEKFGCWKAPIASMKQELVNTYSNKKEKTYAY